MPAVKFTGSTPVASTDDLVRLSLPFTVLHDEAIQQSRSPIRALTQRSNGDAITEISDSC